MITIEEKIEINATSEKVFQIYSDVNSWADWDLGLDFAKIDEEFKTGAVGKLKPKKSPVVADIDFIEVIPNSSFSVYNRSILCIFNFYHTILEKDGFVEVTHRVEITDRFKFFSLISSIFGKLIGKDMKKELPKSLKRLKHLAEN